MITKHSYYTLSDSGEPVACDLVTWTRWMQRDAAERRVGLERVGESVVCTSFFGVDRERSKSPTLWETRVTGRPWDCRVLSYRTRTEAERGHTEVVSALRAALTR